MLIRFSVSNFLSFNHKIEFSTIATSERQHRERIAVDKQNALKLLPISAIYGANASGKSNFVKALDFARSLIVDGTKPNENIPVKQFRIDKNNLGKPSEFIFELKIAEKCFEYGFKVDNNSIREEWLKQLTKTSEKILYSRGSNSSSETTIDLNFYKKKLSGEEFQFHEFLAKGTRHNQLFLTESIERNSILFKNIYDWFKKSLVIIMPKTSSSRLGFTIHEEESLKNFSNSILNSTDTGISELDGEIIDLDTLGIPDDKKQDIEKEVTSTTGVVLQSPEGIRYHIRMLDNDLSTFKLVSYHKSIDGKDKVKFEIAEESSGTQRIIDLLPFFHELCNSDDTKVFVIDELDRSLHTLLTRALIEHYLASCTNEPKSQMIFTTHDPLLLDQTLFRRDEIWFLERNQSGECNMVSLSDYKDVRYDKDIRKSYLIGRYGGIPRIQMEAIRNLCNSTAHTK